MPRVLVVGYGNPLRCDDGVAWRAAEALQGRFPQSEVEILCLHQLTLELAEAVSRAQCVIFVDAALPGDSGCGGEVRVKEIQGDAANPQSASHVLSPSSLLSLALRLYGIAPRAFCVTLTGSDFDDGESLSPAVAAVLPDFISRLESLLQSVLG